MSRIDAAFGAGNGPLLIACTVAGDPSPDESRAVIRALIDAGADMLELIVPATNAVADGPVICRAHERAIAAGCGLNTVFSLIQEIRTYSEIPIVLMTYANPVVVMGEERFCAELAHAGGDGLLVVDMPPEEVSVPDTEIDRIFIIAPSTPVSRIEKIAASGGGFLYLVSAPGVTGRRAHLPGDLGRRIDIAKEVSRLPVAVGFGIGSPDTAYEAVAAGADAVIVGSAISWAIEDQRGDPAKAVAAVVKSIKAGIGPVRTPRSSGQ